MFAYRFCRRSVNRYGVLVAGEARAVYFGLVVPGKETFRLPGRLDLNRLEIGLKESSRLLAIESSRGHCVLALLVERAKEWTRRAHAFAGVEYRIAAFQECLKGKRVVVILPAIESAERQRFELRIAEVERASCKRRCVCRRNKTKPRTESKEAALAKRHTLIVPLLLREASNSDHAT